MGYYTEYEINIDTKSDAHEIVSRLSKVSGYSLILGSQSDQITWYRWKEDAALVSKEYPEATIFIEGIGEEYPDIWKAKVKNGDIQIVKGRVVFDDFK